jgi:hypothetical protein
MMEPTVTQSGALYLAHHKISVERGGLARRFVQRPRAQKNLQLRPSGILFLWPGLKRQASR